MNLAQTIQYIRRKNNLSQSQLADKLRGNTPIFDILHSEIRFVGKYGSGEAKSFKMIVNYMIQCSR